MDLRRTLYDWQCFWRVKEGNGMRVALKLKSFLANMGNYLLRLMRYVVVIMFVMMACLAAYKLWDYYMLGPWTRDGKIRTEIVQLSAQVSGQLIALHVKDNQFVKEGELLLEIDPEDYKLKINMAEAQLGKLIAQKILAELNYTRNKELLTTHAISQQEMDVSQANLDNAINEVKLAEASLEKAKLDFRRTRIVAETDGYITNLNIRKGNLIMAGQPLMALVESKSFYAIGYFEETKMPHVEIGKHVKVIPYDGSQPLCGAIEGYGRAIVDQSASTGSQLIQNIQPNYPWVKLAQRIPVRIVFDPETPLNQLVAGSTCTIHIVSEEPSQVNEKEMLSTD